MSLGRLACAAFGNVTPGLATVSVNNGRAGGLRTACPSRVEDRDLGVLFEHARDPDAIRMAAFTSPDFDDRTAFERRWARPRSDGSTTNRVVEIDGLSRGSHRELRLGGSPRGHLLDRP